MAKAKQAQDQSQAVPNPPSSEEPEKYKEPKIGAVNADGFVYQGNGFWKKG